MLLLLNGCLRVDPCL
jgi:hypothetical protein